MTHDTLTRTKHQAARGAKLIFTFMLVLAACSSNSNGRFGDGGLGGRTVPPTQIYCSHSPCNPGAPLNIACDSCVQMICGTPTNSCCNLDAGAGADAGWNSTCVQMVVGYCRQRCDCLDAGTASPNRGFNPYACDCTGTECPMANSPCCTNSAGGWGTTCVTDVQSRYPAGCKFSP